MTKLRLTVAAMIVPLAACVGVAGGQPGPNPNEGWNPADTKTPLVCWVDIFIVNDKVFVGQEPAYTQGCGTATTVELRWRLEKGSVYTFPSDGISITPAPPGWVCLPTPSNQIKTCQFTRPGSMNVTFKYAVKVLKNGTPLPVLDPMIFNN